MNSRDYKIFRSDHYYHVFNRGHNREPVFLDNQDFEQFLNRLEATLGIRSIPGSTIRSVPKNSFDILAYCLMPNHFHFEIKQNTELSISVMINKLITSYAKYFNARYKKIGSIFQDSFKAKHVDSDGYLAYLSAYIHNNPTDPLSYKYSSYQEYVGKSNRLICDTKMILSYFDGDASKYQKFVEHYSHKDHQRIEHLTFEE